MKRPTWLVTVFLCLIFSAVAWIASYKTAVEHLEVDYVECIQTVFVMDYAGNLRHYDLRGGEE